MREPNVYLDDILEAIKNIDKYTKGMSFEAFNSDAPVQNTVIRNFEIMGEAIKRLPKEVKSKAPEIRWQAFAGFRDLLLHQYFNINLSIVWKTVKDDLPALKLAVQRIKETK